MIQSVNKAEKKKEVVAEEITYPAIISRKDLGGLKVQMTKKTALPGVYTSYQVAQKAIEKELAMSRVAAINRKKKDK